MEQALFLKAEELQVELLTTVITILDRDDDCPVRAALMSEPSIAQKYGALKVVSQLLESEQGGTSSQ